MLRWAMRTTYSPAPDVAAEIARVRREEGVGLSEAIDILARRGMAAGGQRPEQFRQRSARLNRRLDVTNIGDVLDVLDGR